jgi:hypothetical protein
MPTWTRFVLAATVIAVSGCPTGKSHDAAPERCTTFGQRCLFEPGKFGTCVVRENCTGPDCLVCQSQH